MKWWKFRRSQKVEDYRDPNRPVKPAEESDSDNSFSINERIEVTNSDLAKELGDPSWS